MGEATESLADKLGAGIGGLAQRDFRNAAEMIIAFMELRAGYVEVVKASITGLDVGKHLLVLGLSILAGGLKHKSQNYNRTAASMSATFMAFSAIGLVVPAVFHLGHGGPAAKRRPGMSLEISIVLFVPYILSLLFTLKTHKDLYLGADHGT